MSEPNSVPASVVDATDAIVATLSARLDALLTSWQIALDGEKKARPNNENAKPRTPVDVLAELERELADIERHCAEARREADIEAQAAREWEQRAMMALRENREDLAKQALNNQHSHMNAASVLESEAIELEAVRDAYRNAITAVKSTTAV